MLKKIVGGLVGVIAVFVLIGTLRGERLSGIPDAINSFNFNGDLHLSVVANEKNIEDKAALAVKIIDMCRNNEFHTIKFSYDIEYPASLSISVYESRKGFEKNEVLFHIDYETEDRMQSYNIIENPEQYQLFLDGKIIEYSHSDD